MIKQRFPPLIAYREAVMNKKLGDYMIEKKVLIAAPIGGKKQYSINHWFQWIADQEYKNFDVCLCVNGEGRQELLDKIIQVSLTTSSGVDKKIISLELPGSEELSIIQRITYSREMIRRYALNNGYDAVLWLDTDTIPAHNNVINRLLSWDHDSVSGLYFYKESRVPVAMDPDTHTNFSIEKLEKAANFNILLPVWGTGYGCLLHRGKALRTPFDYDLFGEERTDDFGHCQALEYAGIRRWLDPYLLCKHMTDKERIKKINSMIALEKD